MMTLVAAFGMVVGGLTLPLFRRHRQAAFKIYLGFVLFVPYWIGISLGVQFIPLAFLVALWAAAVMYRGGLHLGPTDILIGSAFLIVVCEVVVGQAERGHALAMAGSWIAPYILGRQLPRSVDIQSIVRVIAICTILLAIQSTVEFAMDWHPFESLVVGNGPSTIWNGIQYRSRFARSEGALGHAITMGGAIAIGVPFIFMTRWRMSVRALAFLIAAVGISVTFSRNALVALGVSAVLVCLFTTRERFSGPARTVLLSVVGVSALVIAPIYLRFIDGGTGVLAASTEYRANYLSLLPDVSWFGISNTYVEYAPGMFGWASPLYQGNVIVTLDNTILLTALQFGWAPTALVVGALGYLGYALLRSRDNAALMAACGQYFTVATVAMITQFPYLFWLVVGIGATEWHRASRVRDGWTPDFTDESIGGSGHPKRRTQSTQSRRG